MKKNIILDNIRYRLENIHIFFVFHPFKILEFKELLKNIKILKSDIILDIGCGNGLETLILGKKCKIIYGIDTFKENLAIARIRSHLFINHIKSEFILTTLENARFKSEFFDKIFSICVLEHISNYFEVLEEAYRVLKTGGQMLLSVDSLENIEDKRFINYHKKFFFVENYFRKEELKKTLEKIGFKKITIYPICKTECAIQLFIKLSRKITKLDHLLSILNFLLLKKKEYRNKKIKSGLFFNYKML